MSGALLEYAVTAMGGAAAALLGWALWSMYREAIAGGENRFGEGAGEDLPRSFVLLLPYARALAAFVEPVLERRAGALWDRCVRFLAARLEQAGEPGRLRPAEVAGLSGIGALVGFVGGGLFALALDFSPAARVGFAAAFCGLGGALPWVWLADAARRRQRAILRALPYALDLMTLSVEAGLDFTVALRRIVDRLGHSPLGVEFARLLQEIQMGQSRREALRRLKERSHLMDMDFFVSALVQADEMGVGLGPTLRAQAEAMRQRRFLRAEELAMKAPVKIVFPLVAFVLPVTLVVILGPLAIQLWEQFRTMVVR